MLYQLFKNRDLNFYTTVVKTPFALLQIKLKMLFGNAVKLAQIMFCLVPKVLNSVNVVLPLCKMCAVIDTQMTKFTYF